MDALDELDRLAQVVRRVAVLDRLDERVRERALVAARVLEVGDGEARARVVGALLRGGLELLERLLRVAGARLEVGDARGDVAAILARLAEAAELRDGRRLVVAPLDGALRT